MVEVPDPLLEKLVERLDDATHWRVDRKIPLALVLVFLGQLVAGVWFASSVVHTVNEHTKEISKNTFHREDGNVRLVQIEEAVKTMTKAVTENTRLMREIMLNIARNQKESKEKKWGD